MNPEEIKMMINSIRQQLDQLEQAIGGAGQPGENTPSGSGPGMAPGMLPPGGGAPGGAPGGLPTGNMRAQRMLNL